MIMTSSDTQIGLDAPANEADAECPIADLKQASLEISGLGKISGGGELSPERVDFLTRFPLLLNSSHDTKRVIGRAVELLRKELNAEAGTVFLISPRSREVTFWAIGGSSARELEGRRMPLGKGIVSWVIERGEPALVLNVADDPRFFKIVDDESRFVTRDLICVPLAGRGGRILGALQIINRCADSHSGSSSFSDGDLKFLEICAPQVALAVENAMLYQQLEEGKRKLEQLEKKKGEVMTVIAHEFRTPLNLIQNSCELLASEATLTQEVRESLSATVQRGVERLSRLVSGVRDLAGMSNKAFEPKQTAFPLAQLLQPALELIERANGKRKLSCRLSVPDWELNIGGDPALLALALNNLLSNAVRYTADGGEIAIEVTKRLALVKIEVIDTGIGIAPDQFEAIFEKFYEVGDAIHHSSGEFEFRAAGLGLGLATAREIIRAHGSELEVQSVLGQGSRFSFSLPAV